MTDTSIPTGDDRILDLADELARVEQALRYRLGHRIQDLRLCIEPHNLVLTGRASSYYDKQRAQELVKELSGLAVAENRITVDLTSAGSDLDSTGRHLSHRSLRRKGQPPHTAQRQHLSSSPLYFHAH